MSKVSKEEVIKALKAEGIDAEIIEVNKGNGLIKEGIQVNKTVEIRPIIYADRDTMSLESIVSMVKDILKDNTVSSPEISIDTLSNFEEVKPLLRVRLIKEPADEVYVMDTIGDLSVIPYIRINDNMTTNVTKSLFDCYDISAEDFKETVIASARENSPVVTKSLSKVLSAIMGPIFGVEAEDNNPFDSVYYVSTSMLNNSATLGAGAIYYAEDIPFNKYYMLPSSIHEVLIVNAEENINSSFSPEELVDLVRQVNATEVLPEDQLSDNVYYYNGESYEVYDKGIEEER